MLKSKNCKKFELDYEMINGQMDDSCDQWYGIAKFNELKQSRVDVKLCYMA